MKDFSDFQQICAYTLVNLGCGIFRVDVAHNIQRKSVVFGMVGVERGGIPLIPRMLSRFKACRFRNGIRRG